MPLQACVILKRLVKRGLEGPTISMPVKLGQYRSYSAVDTRKRAPQRRIRIDTVTPAAVEEMSGSIWPSSRRSVKLASEAIHGRRACFDARLIPPPCG